ncbi:MAG TPA: plastocyanin/azurin family copper-binding protein [Ktedonobacteraceae bacterium]
MKKILFLAIFVLLITAIVACGGSSNAAASTSQHYTVHMSGVQFNNSSLTIGKGSTITFTTDQGAHNLVVGTNGLAQPESGTPDFGAGGKTVASGQSWATGPWNTAGTFHVTCTYHPTTMTMTVTVTG